MTKQDLIKILDEKIEKAERDLENKNEVYKKLDNHEDYLSKRLLEEKMWKLVGNIHTCTDIKNLLENEVLENEKQEI